MGRSSISEERRNEVLEMAQADPPMTVPAIAQETGISVPTIYKMLSDAGVQPPQRVMTRTWDKLSAEQVKEFIERYLDNEPMLDLLDEFDINHNQMYAMLRANDVKPRLRNMERAKAQSASMEHALALYQETNLTVSEIVHETGVHQPQLHAEIRRREIPLRRPRAPKKSKKVVQTESSPATAS